METSRERGGVGLWMLIVMVVLGGIAGYRIGKARFDHRAMMNEVSEVAKNILTFRRDHRDPRERIREVLSAYDVPLEPDDISVEFNADRDRVTVSFAYIRDVDLFVTRFPQPFDVVLEQQAAKAVGIVRDVEEKVEGSYDAGAERYQDSVKKAFDE